MASLRIDVVEDPSAFDALEGEWAGLLSRSSNDSITLTWHWLRTWWHVYQEARGLRIVTVRENGRLVGAAPMLVRAHPQVHYRVLPFRRMELLASGEAHGHQVCSDYIDWIAEAGREHEVVGAVLDHLCGSRGDEWEEIYLPDVSAASPNVAPLEREAGRRGLKFEVIRREPCSVIRLPRTWEAYLESVGSNLRYKIRRGRRELERLRGEYHVVRDEGELPTAVDTLVRLHQGRWNSRGRPGAFASRQRLAFHQRFMPIALRQGWLRLGILLVEDEAIGAIYNFRYGKRISFYQSGITVPDNTHLRPGLLMHSFEVQAAIESGCEEYDFLKRGHSEYKDAWTDTTRDLLCIRIAKRGGKEAAYTYLRHAHQVMREVKSRLAQWRAAAGGSHAQGR